MADWQNQLEFLGNLALAMLLGGLIGTEREMAHKPAGFRTHMLVAGMAALLMGTGRVLLAKYSGQGLSVDVDSGMTRIMQGIITGVSFLGAGTIFRHSESGHIEGLTTAASLLFVTVIGMAVGAEEILLAVGATVLGLLALRGMSHFELGRWPFVRSK